MRWRRVLLDNLWWKLLSFALAVMIWSGAQNLEVRPLAGPLNPLGIRTFMDVPIRVLARPNTGRPIEIKPASAQIDVGGEAPLLQRLDPDDALVYVELPDEPSLGPTTNRLEVRLPSGTKLLNLLPTRVIISRPPVDEIPSR